MRLTPCMVEIPAIGRGRENKNEHHAYTCVMHEKRRSWVVCDKEIMV